MHNAPRRGLLNGNVALANKHRGTLAHASQHTCAPKAVFMMCRAHETLRAACSDGEQHSYKRGLEIRLRSSTSHDRVREVIKLF
jgi:hypothetical protein